MFKDELLNEVIKILHLNGFRTLLFGGSFDILGRNGKFLVIKVLANIDALSKENANNIKTFSHFFSAYSLIVSLRSNHGPLSSNIIYSRFDIPVMTLNSFETTIENEWLPSIFAIKGKHIVEIDTSLLKRKREDMKLSLESLGKKLNISKKCLYEIENQRVNPTLETVEKLKNFFGIKLTKPYRLKFVSLSESIYPQTSFQKKISFKFKQLDIDNSCLSSLPFEVIGKKETPLLAGLSDIEKELEQKTKTFQDILSFTESTGVFITKKAERENLDGIPIILYSEISEIDSYEDFSSLIEERK